MAKVSGRVTLKVTDSLPSARLLMIEPWTGEYDLPPGKTLDVLAEGDLTYPLEIEVTEDRFILYGFDSVDSMLTVFDNGKELKSYPRAERRE
jgi:hypothetical protein